MFVRHFRRRCIVHTDRPYDSFLHCEVARVRRNTKNKMSRNSQLTVERKNGAVLSQAPFSYNIELNSLYPVLPNSKQKNQHKQKRFVDLLFLDVFAHFAIYFCHKINDRVFAYNLEWDSFHFNRNRSEC